jgi:F420-non-reducing hydrogenase small subunit
MTAKPRLAMYWAAACGGCDIAVLNLDEALVDVASHLDIVFWPAVMDAKYADVEAMPDASIDVTLFCGGIRNDENEHLARLLRAKSRILVAFGSCASEGCIPGLANLSTIDAILDSSYAGETTENPDRLRPVATWTAPEGPLHLPTLSPLLRTLDQVVPVDYVVPGCPPETKRIAEVVHLLVGALEGTAELPPPGSVLGAGRSTVCDECDRERNVKHIARFARITDLATIDPTLCLLEQGIPCNGPATRDGCGALCPAASAPCIGCYGPADGVLDYGARLLSAFASVVDAAEPAEIEAILDGLADPVGQIYRFSLAGSLLRGSRAATRAARPDETPTRPHPPVPASGADDDAVARPEIPAATAPEPALAAAGGPRS